ncbi:hypothetical protein Godav_015236 [Gossypium davidsonii]|uniref:Transposase MuDR plant domain-containing protein n=1 Tax=Gossypium davidsonii TaxID=34287 RepID=A0A7J8RND7_GOSDV|nr:hypothetical protein [Gossypium davidsonii]
MVKFKEIDLSIEHEVDNPIIVGEMFLFTVGEGDVKRVEIDGEGDDKGVESDGEGDLERVESVGEDDVRGVQADGEGVSVTGIEVDEYGGVESGGQISLGFTVGEDNDSEVAADEYANGVDNVTAASIREEEDGNETEVWDSDEHESLVGFDEDEEHEDKCRRQLKFIKNKPKRVVVRCIAYPNCPWRIRTSYSLVVKCL